MIQLMNQPTYLIDGKTLISKVEMEEKKGQIDGRELALEKASQGTISFGILQDHSKSDSPNELAITFDELASHDITYVGIIQSAMASGMEKFPIPYILTNCHNSLAAVGGTINEDDHRFGLSAAKRFGGIFVPAHQAVIHSYMREMYASCGKMIMGSDSHTRYGALGTMAVGEGGPEIAKQLLSQPYQMSYPDVVGVYLKGDVPHGVGPQDLALAIVGAVFKNEFVKNAVMEFIGPGVEKLSVDFRNGVDVMTTETTCWSSIWSTDQKVKEFLAIHGRISEYKELKPNSVALYDRMIVVDLGKIQPMIELPFHPSNVFTIAEVQNNGEEILKLAEAEGKKMLDDSSLFSLRDKWINGALQVDQGVIAGCSGGTFENIVMAARILGDHSTGDGDFSLSIYPGSQPINLELARQGVLEQLMLNGVVLRTAFCGPCFGAGDTPANGGLSVRHATRNFPNREGSKPGEHQIASVALMDARSVAATALNQGKLTSAADIDFDSSEPAYHFDGEIYQKRVYQGFNQPDQKAEIVFGPNITPWPEMESLGENVLLKVASVIHDPVTTTDELMPSGETSSFRSNPIRLSDFTLSRKDPNYLERTKQVLALEKQRVAKIREGNEGAANILEFLKEKGVPISDASTTQLGSVVVALRPGDGSAREQAASGQKVLGGLGNIAIEYATKRYRSNLINWGILPLCLDEGMLKKLQIGDWIYLPNVRQALVEGKEDILGYLVREGDPQDELRFRLGALNPGERAILQSGSQINYYRDTLKGCK